MRGLLRRFGLIGAICTVLTACGGGGGGGGGGNSPTPSPAVNTVAPPATATQDILPSGTRIDVSAKNLFPLANGDTWTYRTLNTGGQQTGTLVRAVEVSGNQLLLRETDSSGAYTTAMTKSAGGITQTVFDDTLPPPVQTLIGSIPLFVEPLYPVGTQRILRRTGSLNQDLNGDGVAEGFRFEFTQTFQGFESLTFGTRVIEVAHFSTATTFSILPSDPRLATATATLQEESYFAAGFGMVKAEIRAVDGNGALVQQPYTLVLDTARVAGRSWTDALAIDGTVRTLSLTHKAVVYDPARAVYYLSVPATATSQPNTLAVVDATSGNVTHVALPGADPSALALASDGNSLYVGANGLAAVLRLSLPAMTEIGRFALPANTLQGSNVAETIAPSPTAPGTVAVSLASASPFTLIPHDGVILARNQVVQSRRTTASAGNNPRLVFSADGTRVFGYDNMLSSNALNRLDVVADGVQQVSQVLTNGVSTAELSVIGNRLVLQSSSFSTVDLSLSGSLAGVQCMAGRSAIFCLAPFISGNPIPRKVQVLNPSTLAPMGSAVFGAPDTSYPSLRFIQGPSQQLAISDLAPTAFAKGTMLTLFTSSLLP